MTHPGEAVGKAHQRMIREEKARAGGAGELFGAWWSGLDLDLAKADVREIGIASAKSIILEYEWLGTMPAVTWHDGACAGVACYGPEYSENLGVWDSYGFTGRMILLARGACVHWAPPNAGSALVARSLKLLPAKYKVVTATVDCRAGEVGTIYQACNFLCCRMNTHPRSGGILDGRRVGSRAIRQAAGCSNKATIKGMGLEIEKETAKLRYFAFRGSRAEQKQSRAAVAHLAIPYPKRLANHEPLFAAQEAT